MTVYPYPEKIDLTSRQIEILTLISKGCSNVEIAEMLKISPNTVKTHVAMILERMNVSNRTEASVLYERHLTSANQKIDFQPVNFNFIKIIFLYDFNGKKSKIISENLSQLLHGYEIFSIQSKHIYHLMNEKKLSDEIKYMLTIDELDSAGNPVHLTLSSLNTDNDSQETIFKTNHSLLFSDIEKLIKSAVQIYRCILKHEKRNYLQDNFNQLCKALNIIESLSLEQFEEAIKLCNQLIDNAPKWHVPYAIKSVITYKMITYGYLSNEPEDFIIKLSSDAKRALSLCPSSAWSQLAFAYYCALSSDLKLAKIHLIECLKLNPCQFRALQLLGQIYAFQGNIDQSIETFNRRLNIFPSSESEGLCYGALSLVYYCAKDYENSQKTALRALMFEDSPEIPMLLTLISIAELQQEKGIMKKYIKQLHNKNLSNVSIQNSISVAKKIVPPKLLEKYLASLKRARVIH